MSHPVENINMNVPVDIDGGETSEPNVKKQRIEEPLNLPNEPSIITRNASQQNPRISMDPSESIELNTCLVCFEQGTGENPILVRHNCPTCVADAWKICEECDARQLSRTCPVCRSDYAPQLFYSFPGPPLCTVLSISIEPTMKIQLVLKIDLMKSILGRSNIAVWCPESSELAFSFPRNDSDEQLGEQKTEDVQICIGKVRISSDCIKDGVFSFTNKIWDEIINQSEDGNECQTVSKGKALKFIVDSTSAPGSILFTPFPPEVIENILNESSKQAFSSIQ